MTKVKRNTPAWEARRQKILVVSARLFAARGQEGVTIRDIGRACGMHMSTLYYYFGNKASLYDAVFAWACDVSSTLILDTLASQAPPEVLLRRLVTKLAEFFNANHPAAALLDRELLFSSGRKARTLPDIARMPPIRVAEVLTAAAPPLLAEIPAMRLGEIIWDVVYGLVRYAPGHVRLQGRPQSELETARIADEAWLLVRRLTGLPDVPAEGATSSELAPAKRRR